MDTGKRTLVKGVIWAIIGLVSMAVVGLIFTGSLVTGGIMALVNSAMGLAVYVIYERIWASVRWGRNV